MASNAASTSSGMSARIIADGAENTSPAPEGPRSKVTFTLVSFIKNLQRYAIRAKVAQLQ